MPTATRLSSLPGFQLPHVQGSLQYSITGSESINDGNNGLGGTGAASTISGNLAFLSPSKLRPFSLVYSGGYLGGTNGYPSTFFQNLALSQVLETRHLHFVFADSVNYLPNTATTGLSGVPGVGDLNVDPVVVGTDNGQGILSSYASRVGNTTSGTVQRRLSAATTLDGTGIFGIQRFLGGDGDSASSSLNSNPAGSFGGSGLDSNQITGIGGVTHRLDARNSLSGNYTYSRYSFPGSDFTFLSQGANIEYSRLWSRRLSTDASIGPQISSSSAIAGRSLDYAVNAVVTYSGRATSLSAHFTRSTNSGSGVVPGARTESFGGTATRRLSAAWNTTAYAGYTRTTNVFNALPLAFASNSVVGSAQVGRAIGRNFSAYGSYTAQRQSAQTTETTFSLFQGLSQIFAFGMTYSPASLHLGQH